MLYVGASSAVAWFANFCNVYLGCVDRVALVRRISFSAKTSDRSELDCVPLLKLIGAVRVGNIFAFLK